MQRLSALFAPSMVRLLAAFALLVLVSTFVVRLPVLTVAAPAIAAALFWALAALVESIMWTDHTPKLVRMRAWLAALCIGVSVKPFSWGLGDESHLRRPGGGLFAFGPLRLAWRFTPVESALEMIVYDAMEQAHRAGLRCCDNCHAARRDQYGAVAP